MPWGRLERSGDDNMSSQCDMCSNYVYDEDEGYYYCDVNLDEDDMYRFMKGSIVHFLVLKMNISWQENSRLKYLLFIVEKQFAI